VCGEIMFGFVITKAKNLLTSQCLGYTTIGYVCTSTYGWIHHGKRLSRGSALGRVPSPPPFLLEVGAASPG